MSKAGAEARVRASSPRHRTRSRHPARENLGTELFDFKTPRAVLEPGAGAAYLSRMDDTKIARMRERARQMRRAASMSTNREIWDILTRAADEADADAAELEAALHRPPQPLPPQG